MPSHTRIRARREALRLRQEDLAKRMRPFWPGVTRVLIAKIGSGLRAVKADELPLFAHALQCDVADLVDPLP